MTDEAARAGEQRPGAGHVPGEPGQGGHQPGHGGQPDNTPAPSSPGPWSPQSGPPASASPGSSPYGRDQYGAESPSVSSGYPAAPGPGGYPDQPVSGGYPDQPVFGGYPAAPTSGGYPAPPVPGGYPDQFSSGYPGAPVSGGYPDQPVSGGYPTSPGPGGYFASTYPQQSIEPSPPPQRRILPLPEPPPRSKVVPSLIGGLLVGALIAGTAAYFIGRASVDSTDPTPVVVTQPAAIAELAAANRAVFPDELITVAEPWLADMSGCAADTDSGGPTLETGERARVLCRDGGMYLHFVAYESAEAKSADLSFRQQISLNSTSVLPGAQQPGRKLGGVTGVGGTYVEYAVRSDEEPALCGIWWNPDDTDTAVYVDVLCDSLGGDWESLRAVWQRHS